MTQQDTLSALIKRLFCQEMHRRGNTEFGVRPMPHFDGGRDKYGYTRKSVWDEAARIVRSNGIDPALYVSMTFWNKLRLPSYNEINTQGVVERCRQYVDNLPAVLPATYKSGLVLLNTLLKELDATTFDQNTKVALALRQYGATATSDLLYYCFGVMAGRPDIVAPIRHSALAELSLHPSAYKQGWPQGIIPNDLYMEAEQTRARFDAATR